MINNAPATDVYTRTEANEFLNENADKTDLDDYYTKSETYAKVEVYNKTEIDEFLDEKANVGTSYSKSEDDTLLLLKADKTQLIDTYSKSKDDALLLLKADNTQLIDSYSKSEDDALVLPKADETQLIDSYSKTEDDSLLLMKADKTQFDEYYTAGKVDALFVDKADKTQLIDSYSKSEDDALLLLKADKTQLIDSHSKSEADELLDEKADKTQFDEYYTARQVDALLDDKADKTQLTDLYSKSEDDALLLLKADKTQLIDSYSKSENDALLLLKADKTQLIDSYLKSEDDALLLMKADKTDLNNFVDLKSTQTVSVQKQFSAISVSSISKQSKNDESILLAGSGDMLVSTLVNQTELQEVRDNIQGKSKEFVFTTQGELNDSMAIQDNIANFAIGDNLYIVDKQVIDFWWDRTDLKELETELLDMSNVVTTLGAATRSGNAITDISIDGNSITPAKNISFVTTEFDQSITGVKTFTSSIISNSIQYSIYDNSSEFLASDGVRAISDINASVDLSNYYNKTQIYSQTETDNLLNNKANTGVSYAKGEDDKLQLAKADKTQLIVAYSKTETDKLLNNKTNTGVSYTKGQDDALLLLKADKTQLIDQYTKGETNKLLNIKTNTGVSYTKGEDDLLLLAKADKIQFIDAYSKSDDDALFLLKADKTQLIDSYTKTETNNLLNNKTDTGVSYTKDEDDTLLFAKADKTQLIDSYTKTQTDNLLNDKANQSTIYTKTETDQLISQIDTGNVDLSSYYAKTKTDELLDEKANTTDLSNYMTLSTAQTINANKIFNNSCRFVSSFDGMSTVTGSSFIKSGADNTVVLLGAGGTKPISDDNDTVLIAKNLIDAKLSSKMDSNTLGNLVNTIQDQTVNGFQTFTSNVTAAGFVKTDKDDTSVLLAGGGDKLISSFGGIEDLTSFAFSVQDDVAVITYIPFPNHTVDKGGYVSITHST
ncbi:MAG: hypothetical protein EZS28_014986 [Streblomastix strix]|uniref:Uncharacterized protein n=1 Tax=Streblomastix strix TaxID=222440 RepID=A0A5J4W4X2_9EUKA|nr:MAG: hypothetical protein EZS28_014986 [Streblomastix strix]